MNGVPPLSLADGRFARLEAIEWWDQQRLGSAKVLVIGSGALGNEALKNLALLGIGHVAIADQDYVELSNLSRSVLFRERDEGAGKAETAARALRDLYPDINVIPLPGNVLADLGLGWFRWADVVVGALDNREARVFVNSACARVGTPWIDGGIEVLQGIVRGFHAPRTACYECTMSSVDWDLLAKRRSCSLLARRAIAQRGTPTTPTTASVVGGMQAQEVVKILHGLEALLGRGFVFEGAAHGSYSVNYRIHPDCPWHEPPAEIVSIAGANSDTPLRDITKHLASRLDGLDSLDFSREVVERFECSACGTSAVVWKHPDRISEQDCICPDCGTEASPRIVQSLVANSPTMALTPKQIGLPPNDILWGRNGERSLGIDLFTEPASDETPA